MQRARELIQENRDSANLALFAACTKRDIEVVVCLVKELGANVYVRGNGDRALRNPILFAAYHGHFQSVCSSNGSAQT